MLNDDVTHGKEIRQVSEEITKYLRTHEGAADTFEGLVHWWIARQRIVEEEKKVSDAINYLCVKGVLVERILPGGAVVYALSPEQKASKNEY